jgi:23S rRNA pseudouridine1911/1915/1917 synthase
MQVGQYLRWELHLTRAQIRTIKFRENGILVNGVWARVNRVLAAGDELKIALADKQEASRHLIPAGDLPDILYEDEDVICVDKPAGLVVHPSHGHYSDSLANSLRAFFLKRGTDVQVRSIGRLDRDTAGVVVFAKNRVAAARLWQQREQGIFQKEYLAWCEGEFSENEMQQEQTICAPIAHEPGELMKMCVVHEDDVQNGYGCTEGSSGRVLYAVTHYQVLQQRPDCALVRLHLETGRTHQIRVHMADCGHPLLGDSLYGSGKEGETHAQLLAWKAEFVQPFTGERVTVHSRQREAFLLVTE